MAFEHFFCKPLFFKKNLNKLYVLQFFNGSIMLFLNKQILFTMIVVPTSPTSPI